MSRFSRINVSDPLRKPGGVADIVNEEARLMAEELAKFGSERMKQYIRERGTPFSKAAQAAGINRGPGRVRTGNMYNSVDYRVEGGQSRVSAAFGWIRNFEHYFVYQELGFRNLFIASYTGSGKLRVVGGQPIIKRNPFGGFKNTRGMFALRDSRADAQAELPRLTQKYKSRITKRSNKK